MSGSPAGGRAIPSRTPPHAVRFYESDTFLSDTLAAFVRDGLNAREPMLVIADGVRHEALGRRLSDVGLDLTQLSAEGSLTLVDARECLAGFMNDGEVDPDRFAAAVGELVLRSRGGSNGSALRAYGEMVDLLCRDGRFEAALRLEELWNELAAQYGFSLLCVYAIRSFDRAVHESHFRAVCGRHTQVIPTELYTEANEDAIRLGEVTLLQHKARALEVEIEQRKQLEGVLRQERERAEMDRERLLESERAARACAGAANKSKDDFLAILSHELRTPLNAILGWTYIANEPTSDEATLRRALAVVQRNANLQVRVVEDLLDVSRIVAGKLEVGADPVDLGRVARAALEAIRPLGEERAVEIRSSIAAAVAVTGDAARLQQVVWNLLSNAVKFTPPGGRVEVRLEQVGSQAHIEVHDTGQGISSAFLPHVFDRFRQAESGTTRRHGGLGLGLAVVRHLVEAHGGDVSAESPGEGRGSTFTVRLPLTPSPKPSPPFPGERA